MLVMGETLHLTVPSLAHVQPHPGPKEQAVVKSEVVQLKVYLVRASRPESGMATGLASERLRRRTVERIEEIGRCMLIV